MSESKNILVATDANFKQEVLPSPQLTLVDFWAEWCGPCRQLGPTLEKIAADYAGKIKVYKMNVDENQDTPVKYGVRGIPTILFLKGGEKVTQVVGNQPEKAIADLIKSHL